MDKVRDRIAPSPTGEAHIGTAYTALFNYALAKKTGGSFVLRIEDTDRKRYVKGAEEVIFDGLRWLGLKYDEGPDVGGDYGPYRQSERQKEGIYEKYAKELVKKGKGYYCFCSEERLKEVREKKIKEGKIPRYDGRCRDLDDDEVKKRINSGESYVIRLKAPEDGQTSFDDVVRGKIVFSNSGIDDQVLLKSDGFPTYHLAVVVDDWLMKITHVIRAEEWLSSTAKHILLYKAFGWEVPVFCHLSLIRNKDKSKISKRKNPVSILWYRENGFLKEALLNYLALLGWSHPSDKEVFGLDEFVDKFSLERVNAAGPVFDIEKLTWLNGLYIRGKSDEGLYEDLKPFLLKDTEKGVVMRIIPLVKERMSVLTGWRELTDLFFKKINYDLDEFKKIKIDEKDAVEFLKKFGEKKKKNPALKVEEMREEMGEMSKGEMKRRFKVIHFAMSGKLVTPPLNETMEILGSKEVGERIERCIEVLSK